MKNQEKWQPSKFIYHKGKLRGSRDPQEVGVSSRLMADLIASHYDIYLRDYTKGRLIDLGCGKVPLYAVYKDLITEAVCVDWENAAFENPYLDLYCNLNETLPFINEEFDTVILSDVLEHIAKPEVLWREMGRIVKLGGKIVINVPFFYRLHAVPYDYFRYTEFALKQFAETNGFKVLLLKPIGGVPEILADIIAKNILRIKMVGNFLSDFVQRLCQVFLKTSMGKKISSKTGKNFPLGYFMVVEKVR